ncbi:MAG: M23 family metallopeptidase [Anaerolineales bacterium]|nr:M23 family metallopeptidase [Anaerolineales bacterium]
MSKKYSSLQIVLLIFLSLSFSECSADTSPELTATKTHIPTIEVTSTLAPTLTTSPTSTPTETPTPEPLTLCTPLEDHEFPEIYQYISHKFAPSPDSNMEKGHHGIDFSYYYREGKIIDGVVIQTIFSGEVVSALDNPWPYGNMIIIETPYDQIPPEMISAYSITPEQSVYHLYAHLLNPPTLSIGDQVICGNPLGEVGNSGNSGNPHLHLEIRIGPAGQEFPGMKFYDTQATDEEMAAYTRWRSSGEFVALDPEVVFELFYLNQITDTPAP